MIDYEDADVDEQWCSEQRQIAIEYFDSYGNNQGEFGGYPAVHVAPIFSVWAVESGVAAGSIGWWVIAGDLPTDYISGKNTPDPKVALQRFVDQWQTWIDQVKLGKEPSGYRIGVPENASELASLLESRVRFFKKLDLDEEFWDDVFNG